MKRVVVTGLGAVTPLGQGVPDFWQRLLAGERGLVRLQRLDPTGLRNETGGEVLEWDFAPAEYGLESPPDLATQFVLQATREALADAVLTGAGAVRIGAVLSTNFGGGLAWEDYCRGLSTGEPTGDFAEFAFHSALGHLCRAFGLSGPASLLSIACASGAAAVGYALDLLRCGAADAMVAGGHDALAPTPLSGLSVLHTMTADDIRPFSADRSGTLFGEGAGILVLETLEHAQARGARVYAEVLGSWQNNNAYHLTAPDKGGAGMARVLAGALDDAALAPECLDYINAHGTGTKPHDAAETEAIKQVLGARAYEIPVSSVKGSIGHLMGAAGAVEALATVKTIETGWVPATVNYRAPDPECDLDCVPNKARQAAVGYAATISAGVGGSNACVVFGPSPGSEPAACAQPRTRTDEAPVSEVVITGIAPIAAIGIGREDFAAGLREGRDGCRPPERLANGHKLPVLAECLDFFVEDYLESEKTYLDRCSELALAACALAWEDADLDWRSLDHPRVGLCLGTAFGCLDSLQNMTARVQSKGVRFGSPVIFTHSFANTPTSLAAIEYDLQGPTSTFCVGDASAGSALEFGCRIVAEGRADVVLAGGVDALSLTLLAYLGLQPPEWVPGEGAGLFVLESAAHAATRGATALGRIESVCLQGASPATANRHPWGHAFGASLALDLAAALLGGDEETVCVSRSDPWGIGATITVRRS